MRLAQRSTVEREATLEQCELCSAPIPPAHRHVLELSSRDVRCACRPCGLLFDRRAAAEGRYRLIPERAYRVEDMQLDDVMWAELRLPVDIAFFFYASLQERVMAYYPSPMGPTESLLGLEAWDALESANPVLATLEPDVEALLVHRVKDARRHWIVPIDECYGLVGMIRTRWRGFTGGKEVWEELAKFYEQLDARSRPLSRNDDRR
jgi:hypothetical protein